MNASYFDAYSQICAVPDQKKRWEIFKSHRMALGASGILSLLIVLSIFIPMLSDTTYYEIDLSLKNQPPSFSHWFGTDDLGRDMFIRVWYGARISLFVGIAAAAIDLCIGMAWGGIAAFAGGTIDELMMRLADILSSIPSLLIVIAVMVVLGSGLFTVLISLCVLGWITMARVVRGQINQLKRQEYVLAAKALGGGFWRILFKHLLPNASGPILVTLTLTIPSAIFTEAFLSYMGLGVQAPIASWGTMASEGLLAFEYYPWRLFFPAAFICLTMLSFNLLGDALQDALNPHS